MIVTIANQKGGVGKTTTAVTLAHGLALLGAEVLVIDLDPQGQAAVALGLDSEPGIFDWLVSERPLMECVRTARKNLRVVPGNKKSSFVQFFLTQQQEGVDYLARKLKAFTRRGLDYVVLDTSPSVGGLQERALYACDLAVVPTSMDFLSADSVGSTFGTMNKLRDHGWEGGAVVLPTFFDGVTNESKQILAELKAVYGDRVRQEIHQATVLRECSAEGVTIWERAPQSRSGVEYGDLVHWVKEL
jgi:chromosome partitioning protein